jgi:hypothetical protein
MKLLIMLYFHSPIILSLLDPDVFLITYSQTSSNYIEFNAWKMLGNAAVLYVLFPQYCISFSESVTQSIREGVLHTTAEALAG